MLRLLVSVRQQLVQHQKASGTASFAGGTSANASGLNSVAIGGAMELLKLHKLLVITLSLKVLRQYQINNLTLQSVQVLKQTV